MGIEEQDNNNQNDQHKEKIQAKQNDVSIYTQQQNSKISQNNNQILQPQHQYPENSHQYNQIPINTHDIHPQFHQQFQQPQYGIGIPINDQNHSIQQPQNPQFNQNQNQQFQFQQYQQQQYQYQQQQIPQNQNLQFQNFNQQQQQQQQQYSQQNFLQPQLQQQQNNNNNNNIIINNNIPQQNFPQGAGQQPSMNQNGAQNIPDFKQEDEQNVMKGNASYQQFFGKMEFIFSIIVTILFIIGFISVAQGSYAALVIFYIINLVEVFAFSKFTKVLLGQALTPEKVKENVQRFRQQKMEISLKLTAYKKKTWSSSRRNRGRISIQDNIIFNYNTFVDVTNVQNIDKAIEMGEPVIILYEAYNCRKDLAAERDYNALKEKWLKYGEENGRNPTLTEISRIQGMPKYQKMAKSQTSSNSFIYIIFSMIGFSLIYRLYFCSKNVMYKLYIRKAVGY